MLSGQVEEPLCSFQVRRLDGRKERQLYRARVSPGGSQSLFGAGWEQAGQGRMRCHPPSGLRATEMWHGNNKRTVPGLS